MPAIAPSAIPDHLDVLVMQPDAEHAVVRDLVFAVHAFNVHDPGAPLQVSFPLFADAKVGARRALGPCVRITGPAEKLYVLTLRHEVAAHLRAGRATTLVRDNRVVAAGRNERFDLMAARDGRVGTARPLVLAGHGRLMETAAALGASVRDQAVFVVREESSEARDGAVDPLGFSAVRTVPVLR